MTTALAILALDEIDGVRALLPRLPRDVADEVVVIDGGSSDGTREHCQELGLRVVVQERRGRGEAFRVAMAATRADAVVFFSPDGNEDPSDIPRLFTILEDGADVAIASRFLPGARNEEDGLLLPLRKWTNQAFTCLANMLWNRSGRPVTDTINGFRGIRRPAFVALGLRSMGYTIEFEMTIRAMKQGLSVVEIPTHEGPRLGGTTKAPSFRTGVRFLRFFLTELVRRS